MALTFEDAQSSSTSSASSARPSAWV